MGLDLRASADGDELVMLAVAATVGTVARTEPKRENTVSFLWIRTWKKNTTAELRYEGKTAFDSSGFLLKYEGRRVSFRERRDTDGIETTFIVVHWCPCCRWRREYEECSRWMCASTAVRRVA